MTCHKNVHHSTQAQQVFLEKAFMSAKLFAFTSGTLQDTSNISIANHGQWGVIRTNEKVPLMVYTRGTATHARITAHTTLHCSNNVDFV